MFKERKLLSKGCGVSTVFAGFILFWSVAGTLIAGDDRPPVAYQKIYPIYPRQELLNGNEGWAAVYVNLNAEGGLKKVFLKGASNAAFGSAALQAIQEWKFNPRVLDGKPAASKLVQSFRFAMSEDTFFSIEPFETSQSGDPGDISIGHPIPLRGPRPAYPESLRAERVRGHADIIITVNAKGKVAEAKLENATHVLFGESSLITAQDWEFRPRSRGAKTLRWRITFLFRP